MEKVKKSLIFISLAEARHICDKIQYGEATWWEKTKLNIRLIWCRFTKKYTSENTKLTSLCEVANLNVMDTAKKDDLKKLLNKELSQKKG